MPRTIAFNAPMEIGSIIKAIDGNYRIVRQVSRDEWWKEVKMLRELDKLKGLPQARAGFLDIDTREFKPSTDQPPDEFQYCYVIKRVYGRPPT